MNFKSLLKKSNIPQALSGDIQRQDVGNLSNRGKELPQKYSMLQGLSINLQRPGVEIESLITNQNFSGELIKGLTFINKVFKGCDFSNGQFSDATFEGCAFDGCNLDGVTLDHVNMNGCTLDGCNAPDLKILDSALPHIILANCNLDGSYLSNVQANGATLLKNSLHHATLNTVRLPGSKIQGNDLTSSRLANGDFRALVFEDNTLEQMTMEELDFSDIEHLDMYGHALTINNCNFDKSNMSKFQLGKLGDGVGCQIKDSSFCGTDLSQANISNTSFETCNFLSAKINNGNFLRNDLFVNCNLDDINGYGSDFSGTEFNSCVMNHSSLESCDLKTTIFDATVMNHCVLDRAELSNEMVMVLRNNAMQGSTEVSCNNSESKRVLNVRINRDMADLTKNIEQEDSSSELELQ